MTDVKKENRKGRYGGKQRHLPTCRSRWLLRRVGRAVCSRRGGAGRRTGITVLISWSYCSGGYKLVHLQEKENRVSRRCQQRFAIIEIQPISTSSRQINFRINCQRAVLEVEFHR